MMANTSDRVTVIKECIEYKDPVGLKKLILEDEFKDDAYFWELISILGDCITGENLDQWPGFVDVCEKCIVYIVGAGNAAELLLALLEQADSFTDTVKFQTFLQIIQKALLRLETRQQFSLELSLETLADCVRNLELPKSLDLEGDERRAYDLDPCVDKINKYVMAYLEFLKPFVNQLAAGHETHYKGDNFQRQVECLVKTLMNVLDQPLVYVDLTVSSDADTPRIKSDSRLCAEALMQLLVTMFPNIDDLMQSLYKHNEKVKRLERHKKRMDRKGVSSTSVDVEGVEAVPLLGLSCLAYLVQYEGLAQARRSCLYTAVGVLEAGLPWVLALLLTRASEVQRKGVLLLDSLLAGQPDTAQLDPEHLQKPEYYQILDAMFDIMIHCSVKDIRQGCLKLVPVFIAMFTQPSRYRIFTKLFARLKHPGAYGFCVQLFKSELEEVFKSNDEHVIQSSPFCNVGLHKIFNLITSLSSGAATDFVENSDRIISVLNFCRYIVLRDPCNQNQSGFWDFSEKLENGFLHDLQTGLDMAKGHYKLELTGLTEGKQSESEEVEMSVCVAGFKLPKMEVGQKREILSQALNTLDLTASLLARLNELMDQQKKLIKC